MIKELKIATFLSLIIVGTYLGVVYTPSTPLASYSSFIIEVFLYSFFLTLFNIKFHSFLSKKYPWEHEPQKRLLSAVLGAILVNVLGFALMRALISMIFYKSSPHSFLASEQLSSYALALGISVAVTFLVHLFYFYKSKQEKKLSSHKLKAGVASAQLDALKNQLDPHFLFNSLNVLTSLIEESPEKAQDFTTTLSRVYRYVLEKKHEDLVPLHEEISFGKAYMKLLKMRFEEGLTYEFLIEGANLDYKISPLSLQLLLENAIKHNKVSEDKPLVVKVYLKNNSIVVENNKQIKSSLHSSGFGLKNISKRYSALTSELVVVENTAKTFKVSIPLITKNIKIMNSSDQILDEKRYKNAKEKVKNIMGFYYHFFVFAIVMTFLAWINYETTDFPWIVFPLFGWGFGLIGHGMEAFESSLFFGKAWEERQITAILERERKEKDSFNKM